MRHLVLLLALNVLSHPASSADFSFIVENDAALLDAPTDGHVIRRLNAGDRVEVLARRSGASTQTIHVKCFQLRIGEKKCEGWLHVDQVATKRQFCRVTHWNAPVKLDLEQGDYAGTYYFFDSGRFIHNWGGGTETQYESGTSIGQLYQYRGVLWAVDKSGDGDLFLVQDDARLCWYYDSSMCASWSAPNPSVKGTSCAYAQAAPYVER